MKTPPKKSNRRRTALIVIGVLLLALVIWLWPFLPKVPALLSHLWYTWRKPLREYKGSTSLENLQQMGVALRLYIDSEGALPPKEVWMDRLLLYLRSDDMTKEEQLKKFRAPGVVPGEFGYAMNGELSSIFEYEIEDTSKAPAIYDSSKTHRNAFDDTAFESLPDPPREGGNLVLWVDGGVSHTEPKR